MRPADEMRRALEECDVQTARRLWAELAPHLPPPKDDAEALGTLHRARTEAQSMPLRLRAYSHAWLLDRGLPSGLPDELRPRAQRLYPVAAPAVGIAVRARTKETMGAAVMIRQAMEHAVLDAEADGRLTDAPFVKRRMMEARARTKKRLFG